MTDTVEFGLAGVRRMIAEGTAGIPMCRTLGFVVVEAEEGRVVLEGRPGRDVHNGMGAVHGGYAATLLDSACGIAVQTAIRGEFVHTTLELKVSYLRALDDDSGVVRTTGHVLKIGRRVGFAEAQIHDGAGRLCATATSTLLMIAPEPGGKRT